MQKNADTSSTRANRCATLVLTALAAAVAIAVPGHSAQNPTTAGGSAGAPTAAEKFKNIQVLKTIPADELIPTMQFVSGSLGVECDFCHVQGAFDKDDKQEKKTAREMMQMVFAINKDNFKGEREVSCNTCHRGSRHPQAIPAVQAEAPKPIDEHEHAPATPADLPSGEPVFAKYIQALGGEAALDKISTRVETGKALMPEGGPMAMTIYTKSPDQRVSEVHTPKGDSVTAYNGQVGWLSFPGRPPRAMSAADRLAAKLDAEAFYPTHLARQFDALKLDPHGEKIGDHDTDLVLGITKGQAPVKFYFDRSSGLLVRMVHYTDTAFGLLPIQLDFADYREAAGGTKTPFRWTLGRPSGSFTIQLDKVEQNAALDEAKFTAPSFAPPPGSPGSAPGGAPPAGAPQGPRPPQGSVPQGGLPPAPGMRQ